MDALAHGGQVADAVLELAEEAEGDLVLAEAVGGGGGRLGGQAVQEQLQGGLLAPGVAQAGMNGLPAELGDVSKGPEVLAGPQAAAGPEEELVGELLGAA